VDVVPYTRASHGLPVRTHYWEEFYWGCLAAHAASRDIYTDITEGSFFLQLPRKSQLLASGGSSSSLTQSRLDFVPPASPLYIETSIAIYRHIASLQGSAEGPSLTLQSNAFTHKTAATGDPLRPNCTRSCSYLDCERSPIKRDTTTDMCRAARDHRNRKGLKATASILMQLRTGRIGLAAYLHRINRRDSARCSCDLENQTVSHILLECPLLQDERNWLRNALSDCGIALRLDELLAPPEARAIAAEFMLRTGLLD
jgi:hypothetical protein